MIGHTVDCIFTPEDRAASRRAFEMHCALEEGARATTNAGTCARTASVFFAAGEMTPASRRRRRGLSAS